MKNYNQIVIVHVKPTNGIVPTVWRTPEGTETWGWATPLPRRFLLRTKQYTIEQKNAIVKIWWQNPTRTSRPFWYLKLIQHLKGLRVVTAPQRPHHAKPFISIGLKLHAHRTIYRVHAPIGFQELKWGDYGVNRRQSLRFVHHTSSQAKENSKSGWSKKGNSQTSQHLGWQDKHRHQPRNNRLQVLLAQQLRQAAKTHLSVRFKKGL